jgi:hypothetical protein
MGRDTLVTCDTCGKDITHTGNCVDYRLVLKSEAIPPRPGGGSVTAMMVYPPVSREYVFCGLDCLRSSQIARGQ